MAHLASYSISSQFILRNVIMNIINVQLSTCVVIMESTPSCAAFTGLQESHSRCLYSIKVFSMKPKLQHHTVTPARPSPNKSLADID